MRAAFENALKIAQTLIHDEAAGGTVSLAMIEQKVDQALAINPRWRNSVDREELIKELETRFSVWIGRETFLASDDGHVAWLNDPRKGGWRYWPRYCQWLEAKLSTTALDGIDKSTDRILETLGGSRTKRAVG